MFVFAVGVKLVLNVAMVEMKVAHAKLIYDRSDSVRIFHVSNGYIKPVMDIVRSPYLIPVVTATCPKRLNHPVIQEANGALDLENHEAHQFLYFRVVC